MEDLSIRSLEFLLVRFDTTDGVRICLRSVNFEAMVGVDSDVRSDRKRNL